jgi:hypothetical protein
MLKFKIIMVLFCSIAMHGHDASKIYKYRYIDIDIDIDKRVEVYSSRLRIDSLLSIH